MNIQIQSQMRFGDELALKDFFFVHRLVHIAADRVITTKGFGGMPNATLDSERALQTWVRQMQGEDVDETEKRSLLDWLQLHANLHQVEYQALNIGTAPDLGVVDFSNEQEFYDWMSQHSSVHDLLNAATGQS